jgi:hypothetical protein
MTTFRRCRCCLSLPAWGVSAWCRPCLRGLGSAACRVGRPCTVRSRLPAGAGGPFESIAVLERR